MYYKKCKVFRRDESTPLSRFKRVLHLYSFFFKIKQNAIYYGIKDLVSERIIHMNDALIKLIRKNRAVLGVEAFQIQFNSIQLSCVILSKTSSKLNLIN